ncbi:epoxide hydrolase [soil metagenome]
MFAVRPFTLHVSDADIEDLRARLARTRFPDQAPGEAWAYGTDLGWMRALTDYWRDEFDWRQHEAALNAYPQFTTTIAGIDLHYLHVPGKGPDPMPLVLSHGWPGSIFEFMELIPRLTDPASFGGDPADAFTVVVPSLPGYGLSYAPHQRRIPVIEMASMFAELMTDVLGYERFATQGGDWGASISASLGASYPENVIGVHVNLIPRRDPTIAAPTTAEEERYYADLGGWIQNESAYSRLQGTKPQTLAFGLSDSPVGLAAWIAEKMRAWSDCDGDIETVFTKDQILANVSLYWFTGAIGSSFWPYYAFAHGTASIAEGRMVDVPMGYCEFPTEIMRPPRSIAAQLFTDIRRWTVMPRGGHFAAMEQPEALAAEISAFYRPLR